DTRDLSGGNDVFVVVAPGEYHEGRERADPAENDHPPDVPDQGKAHDRRKEGADKSSRRILRHLDISIFGLSTQRALLPGARLYRPVGVLASDVRHDRKIEHRWRRGSGPFQRSPVPGIAGDIAQGLTIADADGKLYDLTNHS